MAAQAFVRRGRPVEVADVLCRDGQYYAYDRAGHFGHVERRVTSAITLGVRLRQS